jgi:8-oxo-dGTP diphosphatase
MFRSKYIPPTLTVDAVLFQLIDGRLDVLLIERTNKPFAGSWALPGAYCSAGETTLDALSRMLISKAGINPRKIGLVDQLYTFDRVARDPRGHAVSLSYMCLVHGMTTKNSKETQNPTFCPVDDLPDLAFDHDEIIAYARKRLASKITYSNIISALLPKQFTLSQLQKAYEAILMQSLDKRNFRKKFLSLNLIHETGQFYQAGAHRPAKLYSFNTLDLVVLETQF